MRLLILLVTRNFEYGNEEAELCWRTEEQMNKLLKNTVNVVQSAKFDISFTMLEVGAVSLSETPERFYELLDYFPDSKIIGFVDILK